MHDIRAIRADPEGFDRAMARRGLPAIAQMLLSYDGTRKARIPDMELFQSECKKIAKEVGVLKKSGKDTSFLEKKSKNYKELIELEESEVKKAERKLKEQIDIIPNVLDDAVPDGTDETGNQILKQVGEPPAFDFAPRQHFELGEALGLMDFTRAARLSGARFTILRGALARLERALGQFMLDLHVVEHGYQETAVPVLVNKDALYGTGQLPKFADDLFQTMDGRWLIPTAEVPLANLAANEILPASALPLRFAALTDCFRAEAGSAGRDTRGMLRQHQFRKVELVAITRPEDSDAEHERMTRCAETILERLGLPYCRMLLCAGDTGFSAARTHDLEVWLPGQGAWREISSCSNTRAFQARRMNARYRVEGEKPAHPHMLNGSGVAVGRALIAVMENGQREDGGIVLPEPLWPYMGGLRAIEPA